MLTIMHSIETAGPGGAENVLLNLLRNLDREKYRSIVCLRKEGWLTSRVRELGFDTVVVPLEGRAIDVRWCRQVYKVLKKKGVHLMHAHEFAMNVHCSVLSSFSGVPCVTTVHGRHYYGERWYRRAAYRYAARHSHMVAVSNDIKAHLHKQIGVPAFRVDVVHNGIDTAAFLPDQDTRSRVRHELGVDDGTLLIGAVGNLYPVKGHTQLVKAVAEVKRDYANFRLFIAGRGQLLESLQEEAKQLGVSAHVFFLGFREDVRALLQAMDIFVLPSESEGIPLSLLEAMAAKKPVVVTGVGGIPEVVDSEVGSICPANDPRALAEGLLAMLKDPVRARRLGEAGRRRVERDFSLTQMRARYTDLYHRMVSARQIPLPASSG